MGSIDGAPAEVRLADLHSDTNAVPVGKQWLEIDGRSLLIESVDWLDVAETPAEVVALALAGQELFVGGRFLLAGGQPANCVARWDGTNWHSLGSGLGWSETTGKPPLSVTRLIVWGGDLIVNGSFDLAGGKPSKGFAIWHAQPGSTRFQVERDGDSVRVSWPLQADGYVLEQTPDLEFPSWMDVDPAQVISNQYVAPVASNGTFFRLRKDE